MKDDIGHIHLLSNPALSGIIKIGHTKKADVQIRADELSSSTSIPLPFKVECSWLVEHPASFELRIHRHLKFCRISRDREFFKIDTAEAEKQINFLLYGNKESFQAELESIIYLYRKYPKSFKESDIFVSKIDSFLKEHPFGNNNHQMQTPRQSKGGT